MKDFKCSKCGKTSYSSTDLDKQINPNCPYCNADKKYTNVEIIKNCDTCVICGDYVPEGRMVCIQCEEDPHRILRKKGDTICK
ncbi:MAG: hypothetical protein AB7V48_04380 [Sedimentibacter sp.]